VKTPIEPSRIRKGDLIRFEFEDDRAIEIRVAFDADRSHPSAIRRYLLDRLEPPVELPTEPTLGWATFFGDTALATFVVDGEHLESRVAFNNRAEGPGIAGVFATKTSNLTAFTPATAVPTEAIDHLRRDIQRDEGDRTDGWTSAYRLRRLIDKFLAAIEASA
jgi:hypothetical protein